MLQWPDPDTNPMAETSKSGHPNQAVMKSVRMGLAQLEQLRHPTGVDNVLAKAQCSHTSGHTSAEGFRAVSG